MRHRLGLSSSLIFILSIASLTPATAAPPAIRSGSFGPLLLVFDGTTVSGVFADQRGQGPGGGPQFSCDFLLRGTVEGSTARIRTWTPGDKHSIAGTLALKGDGIALQLKADQPGCGMTSGDMVSAPLEEMRDSDGAGWVGASLLSAKKAGFSPAPQKPAPKAPYVVAFDPLVILERKEGWLRVSYLGSTKPITGWMRAAELTPETPPDGP